VRQRGSEWQGASQVCGHVPHLRPGMQMAAQDPPQILAAYQEQLTPCCNAHDYCSVCSWKVSDVLGSAGRQQCDTRMEENIGGGARRIFYSPQGLVGCGSNMEQVLV